MLVDLARNDVGRIAKIGSVNVTRFMQVARYSHVMHILSAVEAEVQEGSGPVEGRRGCFTAGEGGGEPARLVAGGAREAGGAGRGRGGPGPRAEGGGPGQQPPVPPRVGADPGQRGVAPRSLRVSSRSGPSPNEG